MGEVVNRKRLALSSLRGFLWALLAVVAVGAAGCASAQSEREAQALAPSSAVPVAPTPTAVEVAAVDLVEGAPGTRIEVRATGELVWTSYRNAAGELVVELPNSRPAATLPASISGVGAVASLRIESENGSARPLTRLIVSPKGETEHTIAGSRNGVVLELLPIRLAELEAAEKAESASEPELGATIAAAAPEAVAEPLAGGFKPAGLEPSPAPAGKVERGAAPAPLRTATRLEGIDVIAQGRQAAVRIVGNGSIAYNAFRLEDPPRLVVDLEGVVNTAPRGVWVMDGVAVSRVRVSQFRPDPEPVTRVVFDLAQAEEPQIVREESSLVVRFGAGSLAAATPAPETPAAPASAEQVAAAVAATAPPVPPVASAPEPVPQPSPSPVQKPAPESTEKVAQVTEPAPAPTPAPSTDVEAFGTPVRPAPAPSRVPVALFEASDTQPPQAAAGQVMPEPQREAGSSLVVPGQKKEYVGEPISLDLKDADIRDVLRSFAKISGLNIVVQPGVRGTVTVLLENVPWDQALDQILKINGLAYELDGNIMRIAPVNVLEAEARRAQQLAQAQALSVPLRTVVKRLSYSTAGDMARILQTGGSGGGSILSQRGSITIDARTNTLIIKELPGYIDTVLAVIETLDIPEPQVLIEARIIETTKRFSRSLGIRWGFDAIADPAYGNSTGLVFPNNIEASGGVSLLTGGANGFINLALGNVLDTFQLDARLQAAEAEGLINVISTPKIATLNNETANIQSGLQIPIQTVANNTVSVQFVNATLQLRVTPHVTAEGTVLMDLQIQQREAQLAFAVVGATNAPIATREAKTRVIVRDGGTTVIGGIYQVSTDQGLDRVPGLANVPLLGHLFKNRRRQDENKELLIFVTPRVMKL